ncbi:MAG TPA: transglycosylase SLT domain-containing protein [Bryobacteraceae bacterium]|nr:transglycosylase SLT domain-containing protein [Bryobacteraceae bacterium]
MVPIILALSLWVQAQGPPSLPDTVGDYRAYLAAEQYALAGNHPQVVEALRPIWTFTPVSPLLGKSVVLAARSYELLGQYADALQSLRDHIERLPQPEGWMLLARNAEAAGDNAGAAAYYQRVFFEHPAAKEAADAEIAIGRLQAVLGEHYPPAMPQVRLERAARLVRAGQAANARKEYAAMALEFGGGDRDLARVRSVSDSHVSLAALRVSHADADAERLYLAHSAARRAKLYDAGLEALDELGRLYPKSKWRLRTLMAQASAHLVRNEATDYEPLYRACYTEFPSEPDAATCHWKVAWNAHLKRQGTAMFEEHLRLFPQSDKASAALYFLGRHSELASKYPLSYYTTLVRQKPRRATPLDFQPSATMKARLERAQILERNSYLELAEFELLSAAQSEVNPYPAAMALSETAARRGAHDVAIRYIKRFATGYLTIPMEAAPERFWKLAFPIPYRESLESNSRARGLDPFVVAALVRQESEFNPNAISRAKAYGLTQVLPSTGRQLSRRVGITRFSPSMLFEPEVNLKLGTYYLKSLLDQQNGKWEQTLASYNAGKSRADAWSTWATYREPAEYIETIPFTETRNYIQIVLRNAHVYRRLYKTAYGTTER